MPQSQDTDHDEERGTTGSHPSEADDATGSHPHEADGTAGSRLSERGWRDPVTLSGLICFLVGLPLVSTSDGTTLSVIGLCLEAFAGVALILWVIRMAGEGEQRDPREDPPKD